MCLHYFHSNFRTKFLFWNDIFSVQFLGTLYRIMFFDSRLFLAEVYIPYIKSGKLHISEFPELMQVRSVLMGKVLFYFSNCLQMNACEVFPQLLVFAFLLEVCAQLLFIYLFIWNASGVGVDAV